VEAKWNCSAGAVWPVGGGRRPAGMAGFAGCYRSVMKLLGVASEAESPPPEQRAISFMRRPTWISKTSGSSSTFGSADEGPRFSVEMLSADQQLRLRRAFNQFDSDASGFITSKEMLQVLRLLGSNPTQAEFGEILKAIDRNNDGVVDFREFAQVWWKREQEKIEENFEMELRLAFAIFEHDDSGYITAQELREKLTTLGERMTDAEVDELLAECDSDSNGRISFEEFKELPCWRT